MPRYFIDTIDGESLVSDKEGYALPSDEAARQLALRALSEMAAVRSQAAIDTYSLRECGTRAAPSSTSPNSHSRANGWLRILQGDGAYAATHGLYLRLVATCRMEGRCQAVMDVPDGMRVAKGLRSRT